MEYMNKCNYDNLLNFLSEVDSDFPVPISQGVDLEDYTQKLLSKATLCIESDDDKILSLVAGYTDNLVNNLAYIAIVATVGDGRGKGYAKKLVKEFLEIAKSKNADGVHLYAVKTNVPAVNMYRDIGFELSDVQNIEEKYHFIYYF